MIFVISFDRNRGVLLQFKKYTEDQIESAKSDYNSQLQAAMFDQNEDIEVNLFEASDETMLRKTHARYFQSLQQTADDFKQQTDDFKQVI
jgi:hypothetical protein